jgi:hypothetical protein
MADKIIVMEKDGVSYAKLSSYSGFGSSYVINGEAAVPAPGDKNYAIVDGTVTSIEVKRTAPGHRVGYALYDRYKEITQLPHELPADAFTRDGDGDLCGENAEFYHAVYSEPAAYLEAVEFEIIDKNCEPVTIPSYVTINFPNNIARHRETQHKYSCFIPGKAVFELLWDRVKERVSTSEGKYEMDDYRSIQALRVSERIAIQYHETTTRQYYPTARSRKPRTETLQVRWKTLKIIEIYGPGYSQGTQNREVTPVIRGKDYAELQTNLEAYINSFLSRMEDGKREVCRHCRGEGIVDVTGGGA